MSPSRPLVFGALLFVLLLPLSAFCSPASGQSWSSATSLPDDGRSQPVLRYTGPLTPTAWLPFVSQTVPSIPSHGITGTVTYQSAPVAGIHVILQRSDGTSLSVVRNSVTDASGNFLLANPPDLASGERYYVYFRNGSDGNTYNGSYLKFYFSAAIRTFAVGDNRSVGTFDIANVVLVAPDNQATVPLPVTFRWQRRSATPSDGYDLLLIQNAPSPRQSWGTGLLGYVDNFTLNSLPAAFSYTWSYVWYVHVHDPQGGTGVPLEVRYLSFTGS